MLSKNKLLKLFCQEIKLLTSCITKVNRFLWPEGRVSGAEIHWRLFIQYGDSAYVINVCMGASRSLKMAGQAWRTRKEQDARRPLLTKKNQQPLEMGMVNRGLIIDEIARSLQIWITVICFSAVSTTCGAATFIL